MLEDTLEWRETWGATKDGDVQTQSAAKLLGWYPWSRAISSDRFILPQIPPPPQPHPPAGLHIFSAE